MSGWTFAVRRTTGRKPGRDQLKRNEDRSPSASQQKLENYAGVAQLGEEGSNVRVDVRSPTNDRQEAGPGSAEAKRGQESECQSAEIRELCWCSSVGRAADL